MRRPARRPTRRPMAGIGSSRPRPVSRPKGPLGLKAKPGTKKTSSAAAQAAAAFNKKMKSGKLPAGGIASLGKAKPAVKKAVRPGAGTARPRPRPMRRRR